jgi:hypothetical protein
MDERELLTTLGNLQGNVLSKIPLASFDISRKDLEVN